MELATRAARECLERAGCRPHEVGLIVYTGLYRDDNVCEPAIAPFVQEELGANPSCGGGAATTFSFDLANGTCGFVNALHVVDGFLESGRFRRGLVVTSDVDSTPGVSEGCRFEPGGGAVLLTAGGGGEGFSAFASESFAKHSQLFEGAVHWRGRNRSALVRRFRRNHALSIREDPEYVRQCSECAAAAVERFLGEEGLVLEDVDLFALSSSPAGFPTALARRLGIAPHRVAPCGFDADRWHTAAPVAALQRALESPGWQSARRVVLVAVGAGINVSLALYRKLGG